MRIGFRLICLLTLVLAAQACTLEVKESSIIQHDDEQRLLEQDQIDDIRDMGDRLKVEQITLTRSDGALARGLWLRRPDTEQVLIYFGGNSMRIAENYGVLEHLLALETDLVWLDHRGLGSSTGEPGLVSLKRDGLETFDYVASRTDKPIALHGMSLGSFIAGHVAVNRPAAGLILEASATNAGDWAQTLTPWYAKPFVKVAIDPKLDGSGNERTVRRYTGELFILVGEDDDTTPVALSRSLYDQAETADKHFHVAAERGHGNAITENAAKAEVRKFLQSLE